MQTLMMQEDDWVKAASIASEVAEAPVETPRPPIDPPIGEAPGAPKEVVAVEPGAEEPPKPTEVLKDSEATKAKQVERTIPEDQQERTGEEQGGKCPKDKNSKEDLGDMDPEGSETKKFPMVRREDQVAFKQSKANVQKMDEVEKLEEKPQPKRNARQPRMKRPAASPAFSKAQHAKLASPVAFAPEADPSDPIEVASDCGSDVEPKNLSSEFDAVADAAAGGGKGKGKGKAKKGAAKTKPKKKNASPKAKVEPAKTRKGKGVEVQGKVDKDAKAKGKAKAKAKKEDKDHDKADDSEPSTKKTFAGRRVPKEGPAKVRFDCMKEAYNTFILPHVRKQASNVEACGYKTHGSSLMD